MGYYTSYELEAKKVYDLEILEKILVSRDLIRYVFCEGHLVNDMAVFPTFENQKWYDHQEDMLEISKLLPDMKFKLHCTGEEGEQWNEYFHNGKLEICDSRVIFDQPKVIDWDC